MSSAQIAVLPRASLPRGAAFLLLVAVVALVALGGCATTTEKGPGASPVWEEKSPYGFHRSISHTLLRTEQPGRAVPHIRQMLQMKPERPEPHHLMARALLGMQLYAEAKKKLTKAIELDPKYAPAHATLGILHDSIGEHRRAEQAHRRAIAIDSSNASFHNNLGFCYFLQRRYSQAIASYTAALDRDPSIRRVHNNVGFALAETGKLDKAYHHFKLAGHKAEADNNMGMVYEGRGDLVGAYDHFYRAVGEDPGLKPARENLARICKRLGKPLPDLLQKKEAKGS